ncbi:MAG: hypothetical protein U0V73_13470 [Acidimicrobiia bacterium]
MAVDERSRHALYLRLEAMLGAEHAETLMEHLPPVGWADVATKRDVEHETALLRSDLERSGSELRREMAELRGELRGEMAELRGEMAELRGEMAELRTGFRTGLESTRFEILAVMRSEMNQQTRAVIMSQIGTVVAVATAVLAAMRLT